MYRPVEMVARVQQGERCQGCRYVTYRGLLHPADIASEDRHLLHHYHITVVEPTGDHAERCIVYLQLIELRDLMAVTGPQPTLVIADETSRCR